MSARPFAFNAIAVGGGPESGALFNSYIRSTSTRSPLYTSTDIDPVTGPKKLNPFAADADGRVFFYFDPDIEYTWRCTTANGATIILECDVIDGVLSNVTSDTILIDASWIAALNAPLGDDQAATLALPADNAYDIRAGGCIGDDSFANQALLTSIFDEYAHVKIPAETFRQTGSSTITDATPGRLIRGAGRDRSIIKMAPGTDFAQIGHFTSGVEYRDIGFQGTSNPPTYDPASTNFALLFNNADGAVAPMTGVRLKSIGFYDQLAGGFNVSGGNQGVSDVEMDDLYARNIKRYGVGIFFKGVENARVGSMTADDCGSIFQTDDGTDGDDVIYPTAIAKGNPTVLTMAAHGMTIPGGAEKYLKFSETIGGMTQIRSLSGRATVVDVNTISVEIDSTSFSNFTSGGYATTLRPNRNLRFGRIVGNRCGRSTIGPSEGVFGHSGVDNLYLEELVLTDNGFDDPTDSASFTGNFGFLANSGQDGLHRSQKVRIGRFIDERSSDVSALLSGVKGLIIDEYISRNGFLRAVDPAAWCPAIRLTDDAAGNSCEDIYIRKATIERDRSNSYMNALIENQCTAARNIYVDWRNTDLRSGVAGYVESGQTTNTRDY